MSLRDADPGVRVQLPQLAGKTDEHFDAESQLIPLGQRLLVKADEVGGDRYLNKEGKESTIVMPEQARKKVDQRAVVVRVGDKVDIDVKVGDRIVYARHAGNRFGDSPCILLDQASVIAKIGAPETT